MSEPLAQALRISGASLVMLTSIESRTTVWSAGPARGGADVAALGAAIAEAAAEMVRLSAAGIEMDDLLVTSPASFHVLRVVDGQVAHLVLDRGTANLAMARREFRDVVAARSGRALPAPDPVGTRRAEPAPGLIPEPERVVPEALVGEVLPPSTRVVTTTEPALPRLPRRRADGAWHEEPAAYQATVPALPAWLRTAAEGPFVNDAQTLARVVGGLRRLQ
jgi:hypothetical protein